jgi:hypothetical protein
LGAEGLLAYLGFIFLPGIGLGEVLGIWREDDGFGARLAYSFGIGLSLDTVVMLVKTTGVGYGLTGIDSWTVWAVIVAGLAMVLLSYAWRRSFLWWRRPSRPDLMLLGILAIQAIVIILYFQKYPIFPNYISQDFAIHARNTEGLVAGTNTSIPRGILYDGVYYQLGPALLLVGGQALATLRWAMGILGMLSPLLFYLISVRLSNSQRCGLIVAVVYAGSGAIWFGMLFVSGLFSNFFGVLASLFLVVVFIDMARDRPTVSTAIVLALATVNGYFSHFSFVTLLPAIVAYPLVGLLSSRKLPRQQLVAVGIVILPGLIGVALYAHILYRLFLANRESAAVGGSTLLSQALSFYPVLSYMALEMYSDISSIILAALLGVFIWKMRPWKSPVLLLPLVWLATLIVVAPFDLEAWRYSFEALVPFTILAGFGLFSLLPPEIKGKTWSRSSRWKSGLLLVLILSPIVVTSFGAAAVQDAGTDTSQVSQAQYSVNQAITWLGDNTPKNATFLSVSDWRFDFTKQLIGRISTYEFVSTPSVALQVARNVSAGYIIVTNEVTTSLPPNPSLYPWNNFPTVNETSSNLLLLYQNPDVRVYQIT